MGAQQYRVHRLSMGTDLSDQRKWDQIQEDGKHRQETEAALYGNF